MPDITIDSVKIYIHKMYPEKGNHATVRFEIHTETRLPHSFDMELMELVSKYTKKTEEE